jgi:hypothetical protein
MVASHASGRHAAPSAAPSGLWQCDDIQIAMVKCSGRCFAAALLGSAQAFHVPRAAHTAPLVRPVEATAIADYLPDVPAEFMAQASITADEVAARYEKSVSDPGAFWAEEASRYHWETPFDASNVFSANFKRSEGEIYAKWFDGGTTNLCHNALDRQVSSFLFENLIEFDIIYRSPRASGTRSASSPSATTRARPRPSPRPTPTARRSKKSPSSRPRSARAASARATA